MNQIYHIITSVVDALNRERINALLIGGFAVNYYGYTRNTLDVDFMFAAENADSLCRAMREAGFTNIDRQDLVIFFTQPNSPFRVDFLQADPDTMKQLLSRSVDVDFHGIQLKLPALNDLLAMKLFALKSNMDKRIHKDLPDIANLVIINHVGIETDLNDLCKKFADEKILEEIRNEVSRITC